MARRKPIARGVRRGEIYRAKAHRGWHRLRVIGVGGLRTGDAYALLVEVDRRGRPHRGLDRHGLPRGLPFVSMLTYRDRAWHLNGFYTLETK